MTNEISHTRHHGWSQAGAALLLSTLALFSLACASGGDHYDDAFSQIHFDAVEVNDILAEDPGAMFLVDLRDGNIVRFDPVEEAFDFSAFEAIDASLDAPVPMQTFADERGLDLTQRTTWSLTSQPQAFAAARRGFEGCYWVLVSCDNDGLACIYMIECDDWPPLKE